MNNIIALIVGIIIGGAGFYVIENFLNQPTEAKKQIILNYLVYAVAAAEQTFGSKTGKLKLAKVYNEFVVEMPAFAKYVSYEKFTELVDVALAKLNEMLKNKTIEEIIKEGKP